SNVPLSELKSNNETQSTSEQKEYVTITTNFGELRGFRQSVDNITVNTFYGVPYAAAPIASLRFKDPSPLESWQGVRDAINQPPTCLQVIVLYILINTSLYLS